MVTLAVPELVRVTVCVLLLPTVTSPKSRLAELRLSWPLPSPVGGLWELAGFPATPLHEIRKVVQAKSASPKRSRSVLALLNALVLARAFA